MSETDRPEAPSTDDPNAGVDRRQFINGTWKALGVVLIAEGLWTSYHILNTRPAEGFGSIVDAGPVDQFLTEGSVTYFLNGRFYVTQYQGGLRALYQKCPHLGCRVPFCESSGRFECPCHGSVYNVIGEYISGPAPGGMDRFQISISQDGRVLVDTAKAIEGPPQGVLDGPDTANGPSCSAGGGA